MDAGLRNEAEHQASDGASPEQQWKKGWDQPGPYGGGKCTPPVDEVEDTVRAGYQPPRKFYPLGFVCVQKAARRSVSYNPRPSDFQARVHGIPAMPVFIPLTAHRAVYMRGGIPQ